MSKRQRGPYGRGSIEKRGYNKYRITIPMGKLPDGTYDRYRETFHGTEQEAEQRRTALLHQLDTGKLIRTSDMKYQTFLEYWLENYAKGLEERTYEEYDRHARLRIIPALGNVPLNKLTTWHINQFYARLQRSGARKDGKPGGLSPATIHRVHAVIQGSLKMAVDEQLITQNPATGATLPKEHTRKKPPRRWNERQFHTFLDQLKGHPHRALILTLAFTGIRIGEAFALKWNDIDFEAGTIRVDESLKRPGKNARIGDTKNHQVRSVPMNDDVYRVLKAHRAEHNQIKLITKGTWNPLDLVFPTSTGTPGHRSNFHRRVWKPLIEASGIPYINIHGLRHTFGTLWMQVVGDAETLREILGHHSVAFTLDRYTHPDEEHHQEAMQMFTSGLKRRGKRGETRDAQWN